MHAGGGAALLLMLTCSHEGYKLRGNRTVSNATFAEAFLIIHWSTV